MNAKLSKWHGLVCASKSSWVVFRGSRHYTLVPKHDCTTYKQINRGGGGLCANNAGKDRCQWAQEQWSANVAACQGSHGRLIYSVSSVSDSKQGPEQRKHKWASHCQKQWSSDDKRRKLCAAPKKSFQIKGIIWNEQDQINNIIQYDGLSSGILVI